MACTRGWWRLIHGDMSLTGGQRGQAVAASCPAPAHKAPSSRPAGTPVPAIPPTSFQLSRGVPRGSPTATGLHSLGGASPRLADPGARWPRSILGAPGRHQTPTFRPGDICAEENEWCEMCGLLERLPNESGCFFQLTCREQNSCTLARHCPDLPGVHVRVHVCAIPEATPPAWLKFD